MKLFHTDAVVSMIENWERGLSQCTGELITVIGDDDALLPDACEAAGYAFDLTGAEVVSWTPFLYLWPSYWHERRRNRLARGRDVRLRPADRVVASMAGALLRLSDRLFDTAYALQLIREADARAARSRPLREVLLRVVAGRDVGDHQRRRVRCLRQVEPAVSIAGISGHSYGHKLSREDRRLSQTELERHFPDLAQRIDTWTGSNLESLVAIEMAVLEEQVLRERCPIHFDRRRLAWAMAATINESPSRYDDTKTAILALMREFEIDESELEIPPPQLQPPAPPDGAHLVGPRRVFFVFDGNRIGLTTVADAVELGAQLVPAAGAISKEQPEARPTFVGAFLAACRARVTRFLGRRRRRP